MSYRDAATVEGAVASVLRQRAPEPFEVILVASGNDGAAAIVRERFPQVRVIESAARLLPGAARNAGVAVARGDIVAFLPADARAEDGWVAARLAAHRAGHRVVSSAVTNGGPAGPVAGASYYMLYSTRLPGRAAGVVRPPDGAIHGASFDRAVLDEAGPFDESVRTSEDTDYLTHVDRLGIPIVFDPSVRMAYLGPSGLRAMLRDQRVRGMRFARAYGPAWPGASVGRVLWRMVLASFRRLGIVRANLRRDGRGERGQIAAAGPWIVAATVARSSGWTREQFRGSTDPEATGVPARKARPTSAGPLAFGLGVAAATVYALTARPDWLYDPLRYAVLTRDGRLGDLLLLQHALGNLLPHLVFRGLAGLGYGGGPLPVMGGFAVAGAAAAVALTAVTARVLGGSVLASSASAGVLAVVLGTWRAGGSSGVYGLALAAIALAWLATARYARAPTLRRAALAGAAGGIVVGTHLGAIAFLPAGLLVVTGLAPDRGTRWRAAGAFSGAAVLAGAICLVPAAGLATGWSPARMVDWFLHPSIAGPADPSIAVGFGLRGLGLALVGTVGGIRVVARWLLLAGLLGLPLGRGLILLTRRRPVRVLGAGLLLHVALAVAAAGWYQSLRADYFGLALVPLALLWPVGGSLWIPGRVSRRGVLAVAAGVVIVTVAAWNLATDVLPGLDASRIEGRATAAIVAASPPRARLLLSADVAPRVASAGPDAITGWGALLEAVLAGASRPGLNGILRDASGRPLLVSSLAFDLTDSQAAYLGTTPDELWSALRACCDPRPVLTFRSVRGAQTLYRLTPP